MATGQAWLLAGVAIVMLVTLLEAKPAWGGMMLFTVVLVMVAHGIRSGSIARPSDMGGGLNR